MFKFTNSLHILLKLIAFI